MENFVSNSYGETLRFAEKYAMGLPKGAVVALYGGLGVGKTAFTTGFAKGLGIDKNVYSPTFALVNEYRSNENTLYHFDMYRVETWDDLYSTGFFDYMDTSAYLCIEWSENIDGALPDGTFCVELKRISDDARNIKTWKRGEVK